MTKSKFQLYPNTPVHWTTNLNDALCGSGWLQGSNIITDITCPKCKEILTQQQDSINEWFELSYAQYLTIPRLVMESMPIEWQAQMARLLREMDETFDWRPTEGRYWVTLRDNHGKWVSPPLGDYRRGNIEHLRIKSEEKENGS